MHLDGWDVKVVIRIAYINQKLFPNTSKAAHIKSLEEKSCSVLSEAKNTMKRDILLMHACGGGGGQRVILFKNAQLNFIKQKI